MADEPKKRAPAKKAGTPLAASHLRPESRQQAAAIRDEVGAYPNEDIGQIAAPGRVMVVPTPEEPSEARLLVAALSRLREPFADDQVEKLPRPMWKGAWNDQRGAKCDVCNGYHVLEHCIHLDYVGHANATNRLLDADLTWDWEPMAYTEAGTPLFSDGGLWIKLTVCGVTRIGYGDGSTVKEVIGDAIRNAAMRFGVALDLWSKIDLHAERNTGDGQTQLRSGQQSTGVRGRRSGQGGQETQAVAADTAPAANQDALDTLASVCDEHGYDRRAMGELFRKFADGHQEGQLTAAGLLDADSDVIILFADELIRRAMVDPREPADGQQPVDAGGDKEGGSGVSGAADLGVESAPADVPGAADAATDDEGDASANPEEMF